MLKKDLSVTQGKDDIFSPALNRVPEKEME